MSFDSEITNEVASAVLNVLFRTFRLYFESLEYIYSKINPDYIRPRFLDRVMQPLELGAQLTVDDRIKKIDAARDNLSDAIRAIDELRAQAEANKRDLAEAVAQIKDAERQKLEVDNQLEALKQVAGTDTAAFRSIVGIPSRTEVWKERILGFVSGVIASIIASVIFYLLNKAFHLA